MNKTLKILILVITLGIVAITPVFADTVGGYEFDVKTPDDTTKATEVAGEILAFIQWTSIVGGVIVITILGIKYMAGSLEEKAQYKKSMLPLVIGIAVVVLATTMTKIIFNAFAN